MNPSETLRLIALDDAVVFPNMGITLTVDVGDDERVVLVPRHDNEYIEVGTVADVSEHVRLPGGGRATQLGGAHPGSLRRPFWPPPIRWLPCAAVADMKSWPS